MPTTAVQGAAPQVGQAEHTATWEELSLDRNVALSEVPTVEREPITVSVDDVVTSLSEFNWRRAAKDIFLLINGTQQAVHGLGFELKGVEDLAPERRLALLVEAERRDQSTLEWPEKLECAAFRTAAQLPAPQAGEDRNAQIVNHLKEHSQVGDVIFVSSEGAGEPLLTEVFQTVFRKFSARSEMDYQFPFFHVLVNVGDGKLLHMTFKGVHETTWERLLLKSSAYDAVAVARLDAPKEVREELARETAKFAEDRHFNYLWALVSGPLALHDRQNGAQISDTSALHGGSICLDFATEAARALRARGAPIDVEIENSISPLDLFSAASLKIVEASALRRAA